MRFYLPRDRALGAILGLGLALLALSVLALVMRGAAIYFVVITVGLIIIVPVFFGIIAGLKLVEVWTPPQLSWPMLLAVAVLLWPTALYLPFGIQFLRLSVITPRDIPVHPLAEHERTSVEWGDGVNHGDRVHLFFVTDSSPSDIVQFYRERLLEMSWEEGPAHFIEYEFDDTPYWFSKARTGIIHIKIGPMGSDERTEFEVIYGH